MPLTPLTPRMTIHPPLPHLPPLLALPIELLHLLLPRLRQLRHVIRTRPCPVVVALDLAGTVIAVARLVVIDLGAVIQGEAALSAAYPAVFEDIAHGGVFGISVGDEAKRC